MRPKRVYARTQKNICHNIFLSLVFYHKLIYYFKIRTWNCLNQQTGCMYVLECAIITFYVCRLTFVVMTFVGLVPTFAVRTFCVPTFVVPTFFVLTLVGVSSTTTILVLYLALSALACMPSLAHMSKASSTSLLFSPALVSTYTVTPI